MGDRDGGPGLIGGSETASKVRQVTKGPISAAGNVEALSGAQNGASRDEAPEEMIFRPARRGFQRSSGRGGQSGTQEWVIPRRAAEHRSALISVRPGGAKQKRGFGRRTGVEAARLLFGGSDRWDATPELVSRNSG